MTELLHEINRDNDIFNFLFTSSEKALSYLLLL